jgi:hypothetical protein
LENQGEFAPGAIDEPVALALFPCAPSSGHLKAGKGQQQAEHTHQHVRSLKAPQYPLDFRIPQTHRAGAVACVTNEHGQPDQAQAKSRPETASQVKEEKPHGRTLARMIHEDAHQTSQTVAFGSLSAPGGTLRVLSFSTTLKGQILGQNPQRTTRN